jgi:PIN domain nuclease of toxin-antitoxin system
MRDLLLDTHVWIWMAAQKKKSLSTKSKMMIQKTDQIWISAISCWELAKLIEKKRIGLSIPTITWIRRSLNEYRINVADLSPEIAAESTQLKGFHQDPADQIIVATSRVLGMPLLTSDSKILEYDGAESIW